MRALLLGLVVSASGCSLVLSTPAGDGLAAGCNVTADCTTRPDGKTSACRRKNGASTGVCVPLISMSNHCTSVVGDWSNDNALIFGSILSETLAAGLVCENAISMAVDDFAPGQGLPPTVPNGPRRPIAFVRCTDDFSADTGKAAAQYLVDEVGVPAIIGAEWSGITIGISSVTKNKDVLLISPGATSIQITSLDDKGLVWRTSPSDVFQAAATVAYVPEVEKVLLAARPVGSKIKVYVANKGDSYGTSIQAAVLSALVFNGLPSSDPANANLIKSHNYGDPSEASSTVSTKQAVDEILAFAPDIVIVLGTEEGITDVLKPVELQWRDQHPGISGPRWILGDGGLQSVLFDTVGTNDDLRHRVTGTVPGTSKSLFQTFKQRYRSKGYGDSDPEVFGAAGSYDSVYLLAYSAVTLRDQPITGANLANGFGRLVPPAGTDPPGIDVGVNDILPIMTTLASGGAINLNGASGALNFDLASGEGPSDIQIWCMPKDGSGKAASAQFSGLYLDAVTLKLVGAIGSICQF